LLAEHRFGQEPLATRKRNLLFRLKSKGDADVNTVETVQSRNARCAAGNSTEQSHRWSQSQQVGMQFGVTMLLRP
jgi:hypothetical protein